MSQDDNNQPLGPFEKQFISRCARLLRLLDDSMPMDIIGAEVALIVQSGLMIPKMRESIVDTFLGNIVNARLVLQGLPPLQLGRDLVLDPEHLPHRMGDEEQEWYDRVTRVVESGMKQAEASGDLKGMDPKEQMQFLGTMIATAVSDHPPREGEGLSDEESANSFKQTVKMMTQQLVDLHLADDEEH